MPVHSLIIVNNEGNVLFSKYFEPSVRRDSIAKLSFEQSLFKHTCIYWRSLGSTQNTVTLASVHCVFQHIGDMIMFANGTDDIDETILSEVLVTLCKILGGIIDGGVCESQFLIAENYGKFAVSVEEMVPQGIIESFDEDQISKLSKLKNF